MTGARNRSSAPLRFRGPDDVARFARRCGVGSTGGEGALVFGLDTDYRLTGAGVSSVHGSLSMIEVDHLVALADELGAAALVLVVFDPGRASAPSVFEAHHLDLLAGQCREVGVLLLDGIVMSGHRWWSLAELAAS